MGQIMIIENTQFKNYKMTKYCLSKLEEYN